MERKTALSSQWLSLGKSIYCLIPGATRYVYPFLLVFLSLSTFAQERIHLDSLKNELENTRTDTGRVRLLLDMSAFFNKSDLVKALDYSHQALELAKKTHDTPLILRSYQSVGDCFIFLGDYQSAIENLLDGYRISAENKLDKESLITLNSIGIVYDRLGKFDQAIEYYFKALNIYNELLKQSGNDAAGLNVQGLLNNIGNIYQVKGDLKSAEEYYLKGLQLAVEKNDLKNIGVIAGNLGKIKMESGELQDALPYINQSFEARKKSNDFPGLAKTYYLFCDYYYGIGKYSESLEYAKKSLELAQQVKSLQTSQIASMFLYKLYRETGDFQKALEYLVLSTSLSDSLVNEKNVSQITQLQLKFEYEKLDQEREIKEKRTKYIYLLTLFALLTCLIILILLVIIARSRSKRTKLEIEKLESDIEIKNKELATNVIYLVRKNELINGITLKLLDIKEKLKEENKEPVQAIIFELQNLMDKEVWEEFEIRFQQVHKGFYENLQSRFPELSPSEIKLAAFLRLNMTTKDIASITNQSVKSLEVARSRLRKKLGITNQDVNLINFLLEI